MVFPTLLALTFTAFAVFAWRDLKLAFILLCGLTPTYLVRFSIGPVPSTMLEGFLLIAIGVYIVQQRSMVFSAAKHLRKSFAALRMTETLHTTRYTLALPLFFITLASIIAVIIAPDRLSALGIWKAYYVEPALYGFILWKLFDRDDYRKAFLALGVSGLVIALFAIVQVLFHVGIPDAWATENRATSLFPYPNAVGLLLAPMVSWVVVWTLGARREARGASILIAIVLFCIAIGLAKTEAALVAISAALTIVAMLSPAVSKRKKMLATSGIVLATTCVFLFLPNVASKLTLHDTSGLVRRAQWSETFHMLADHPYFGVGLDGYPTALIPYHDATTYEIFQYPHNVFLNFWSELGLLGLIGLGGLIGYCAKYAWRHREDPWVLACFAALLTMLVHGLVDVPFMKNDLAVISVVFFLAMIAKSETKNPA